MTTQQIFSPEATTLLNLQHQGAISIAQLRHKPINTLEFISIHSAFNQNKVKIEEVSASGNVNELLATNLSNDYIFIMDGDILKGAKQNRVSNTSIYMAPNKKYFIPVSCVEQGRWRYDSDIFSPSDEIVNKHMRFSKSQDIYKKREDFKRSKHSANQSRVWENVSSYMNACDILSVTDSYSDIHIRKRKDFTKMIDKLELNESANGLAYFIHGKLCGIEIFNRNDVYKDYFQKILQAIAMEADLKTKNKKKDWSLVNEDADSIISIIISDFNNNSAAIDTCNGVCLGKEYRLQTGNEMYYNLSYNEQTVHQSVIVFEKHDTLKRNLREEGKRFNPELGLFDNHLGNRCNDNFIPLSNKEEDTNKNDKTEPAGLNKLKSSGNKHKTSFIIRLWNSIKNKESNNEKR
jgi:hypothetical protein